jgi:hypothetical protein
LEQLEQLTLEQQERAPQEQQGARLAQLEPQLEWRLARQ